MTFSQYIQNLGFLLAQWLPICGLMYLAVRLGIQHSVSHFAVRYLDQEEAHKSALTREQYTRISEP